MNQNTKPLELSPTIKDRTGLSIEKLSDFCKKWEISSLALFGSVLRSDFRPDSDIDCLVSFTPEAKRGLLRLIRIKHEFEALTNRAVDIMTRQSIEDSENWIRRREILTTAQVVYEQR